MKKLYFLLIALLLVTATAFARYNTPNTGVRWNLDNLVANSNGAVTLVQPGVYQVNDTVFVYPSDTLYITSNATVRFAAATYLDVNGILTINPPTNAVFTAVNSATGYLGMRIDSSSGSSLRKLTMEYAVSLRIADCSPLIDSCLFRYNNNSTSTSFGTSAITLFRSNLSITNSQFLNNQRAAISGGSNIANAPKIINCLFGGNDTQNANVPQINLGATGTDTARILNNQILRASTMSGGIGFLPTGDVRVVISGNVIKNNRYGIVLQGGSNINALVSYNQIDSNNTQNDPAVGGSGLNFAGGTATSQQNSIVTGNLIRWNLWGITIQNRARPNLGNITNADTTDDGKNTFVGNTNATTPNIDLYNSTVDTIYAQNNYWNTSEAAVAETHIFHQPDNAALGLVIYLPLQTGPLPVKLLSFTAALRSDAAFLNWQTATEQNIHHFEIEASTDGRTFMYCGQVVANGNSSSVKTYAFTHAALSLFAAGKPYLYYRLKVVDKDGHVSYSSMVKLALQPSAVEITAYPNPVKDVFALSILQNGTGNFSYTLTTMDGKMIARQSGKLGGSSVQMVDALQQQPAGTYLLQVQVAGTKQQLKMIKK